MTWGMYEVLTVASGLCLIVVALILSDEPAKSRLGLAAMGAVFMIYGFYAASQESGTVVFPVIIFLIPVAAIAVAGMKLFSKNL